MLKVSTSIILVLLFATEASAATWYTFAKDYSDTALYFFDQETVIRQSDTITIWIKYVNDQTAPDTDGSFATARKSTYNCTKRTIQALTTVTYDKAGKFIRTFPDAGRVADAIPGSVGEGLLKTVCAPDFPKNKSGDLYFPVDGNDIFKHTSNYFEYQRLKNTDPAPK